MGVLILHKDMRAQRFCNKGGRVTMAVVTKATGVTWREFLLNGIDSDLVEGIDNELVQEVVHAAKRRVATAEVSDG